MKKYDTPIRGIGTDDGFLLNLSKRITLYDILHITGLVISVLAIYKACKKLNLAFKPFLRFLYNEEKKGLYLMIDIEKHAGVPIRNIYAFMIFALPPEARANIILYGRIKT